MVVRWSLRSRPGIVLGGAAVGLAVVVVPLATVTALARLAGFVLLAAAAWVTVGRLGMLDLGVAGAAGAGAYGGGVLAGQAGWPGLAGLATGALAGAVVGGISAAVVGRVGRAAGAVTSLTVSVVVAAVAGAIPGAGGAAGYHAVPFLAGGDRIDLAVALAAAAAVLVAVRWYGRTRAASCAAVAVQSPPLAASLGRHPVRDAGIAGIAGGAAAGIAGATVAAVSGSVVPAAYGLTLAAAVALAGRLGGWPLMGPVAGAAVVWGPSVATPLVPVVGDAPPLLVMGPVALGLLAVRGGDPLSRPPPPVEDRAPGPTGAPAPVTGAGLEVAGIPLPGGSIDLRVDPGEVVALVGPNGSGKSTLLARIGGQLPAPAGIRVAGTAAPTSPAAAARRGVARTFQRPPRVDAADALRVATAGDGERAAAAAWAADTLGADATTPAGQQLVRLAASRPALALVDEPGAELPAGSAGTLLRGLADAGAAVLVADHRPEIAAVADRVVRIRP